MIRREVPEFEPTFQEALREEDGELGSFQAISLLAEWARDRLDDGTEDDAVRRVFKAIELLIVDQQFALGDALAAEFTEVTRDHPTACEHMGPMTRERAGKRECSAAMPPADDHRRARHELSDVAASGDREAVRAIKTAKQAGSQGKGGR